MPNVISSPARNSALETGSLLTRVNPFWLRCTRRQIGGSYSTRKCCRETVGSSVIEISHSESRPTTIDPFFGIAIRSPLRGPFTISKYNRSSMIILERTRGSMTPLAALEHKRASVCQPEGDNANSRTQTVSTSYESFRRNPVRNRQHLPLDVLFSGFFSLKSRPAGNMVMPRLNREVIVTV